MGKRVASIFLALALLCPAGLAPCVPAAAETALTDERTGDESVLTSTIERSYAAVLDSYAGKPAYAGAPLEIDPAAVAGADKSPDTETRYAGRAGLTWNDDNEYIEWRFTAPQSALYTLAFDYYTCNDSSADIQRSLAIDGEVPYEELANIAFPRRFTDNGKPQKNAAGDEVAPTLTEVHTWQTTPVYDYEGLYAAPLQIWLTAGEHVLRMELVSSQPIVIGAIRFTAPQTLPTYAQKAADYAAAGYAAARQSFTMEAEHALYKSNSVTRMSSNGDPACSPQSAGYTVINVIGGGQWSAGGQSITWRIEAPESGLYKLGFRQYQNDNNGLPVYRRIAIDGAVPFQEFQAFRFDADRRWQGNVLADAQGEPYLIYLEEGPHELTMTVCVGELTPVITAIEQDMDTLSALYLRITMLTGSSPDTNYDYELEKRIPELVPTLETLSQRLATCMAQIAAICPYREPMMVNQLKELRAQYVSMRKDTYYIPSQLDNFDTILTQYGNWINSLKTGPLLFDTLGIYPPDEAVQHKQSTVLQRFYAGCVNFATSFVKDYNTVAGFETETGAVRTTIDVWVSRGTAWGTLIKQMADSGFTPQTGIGVNLTILPAGQLSAGAVNALLLAIASGRSPDVGLAVAGSSVGEFAFRNAVAPVSQFADYPEVSQRFLDMLFVPLTYQGQVYALPETMNFNVLIYRRDILAQLGLSVPETWDDVYNEVIPVLSQNNMQLSSSPGFPLLLAQAGGEYYSDDLQVSALGTPVAYQAFRQHCEFYTMYGVPTAANFFNRFRSGEMPIGFVDFGTYMTILVAAPELSGRWAIAQMPGTVREDGRIDHNMGGVSAETGIILAQSDKQDEAWRFLKWWMSEEVQAEYGHQIEASMGLSARWNSANRAAFESMSWDRDDLAVIRKAFQETKEYPIVLGGYYTARHIGNAFNRVVISKTMNLRDSLEKAVKDIDKELKRRREGSQTSRGNG